MKPEAELLLQLYKECWVWWHLIVAPESDRLTAGGSLGPSQFKAAWATQLLMVSREKDLKYY